MFYFFALLTHLYGIANSVVLLSRLEIGTLNSSDLYGKHCKKRGSVILLLLQTALLLSLEHSKDLVIIFINCNAIPF